MKPQRNSKPCSAGLVLDVTWDHIPLVDRMQAVGREYVVLCKERCLTEYEARNTFCSRAQWQHIRGISDHNLPCLFMHMDQGDRTLDEMTSLFPDTDHDLSSLCVEKESFFCFVYATKFTLFHIHPGLMSCRFMNIVGKSYALDPVFYSLIHTVYSSIPEQHRQHFHHVVGVLYGRDRVNTMVNCFDTALCTAKRACQPFTTSDQALGDHLEAEFVRTKCTECTCELFVDKILAIYPPHDIAYSLQ